MFLRRLLMLAFVFCVLPLSLLSQDGKMRGKVVDKANGEALVGATIQVVGTSLGAAADVNGEYIILSVPAGTYSLKVSFVGYATVTISNIRVASQITTTQNFEIQSSDVQVQAVEIIAERPLIQRNTTNTIRVNTQENIENLPVRGLQNIVALEAGVVQKDGKLYIRGGRAGEVAYFIDGANTTNPIDNSQNINVIQEALEEVQVQTGGYTAEFGGANAGLVRSTLRTGGSNFNATLDLQMDGKEGAEQFGTVAQGYQNIVATVGGPLLMDDLRFFAAFQNSGIDNRQAIWLEPFSFGIQDSVSSYLRTDDKGALPAGIPLPGPVALNKNSLPENYSKNTQLQGTLLYNMGSMKLKVSGTYETAESPSGTSWPSYLGLMFNQKKNKINETNRSFLNARLTYIFSPSTFAEFGVSTQSRESRSYDKDFGDEWIKYPDSVANYALDYGLGRQSIVGTDTFKTSKWVDRYTGPLGYSTIFQFNFANEDAPNNSYSKSSQKSIAMTGDFTSQINSNWELKGGFSTESWTIRSYSIGSVSGYLTKLDPNKDGAISSDEEKQFTSDYHKTISLIRAGGISNIGWDYLGATESEGGPGVTKPGKPVTMSGYLQNKFEYNDLVLNFGARFESFAPNGTALVPNLNTLTGKDDYNQPVLDTLSQLQYDELGETGDYTYLLPRVSFSFPVTENTVFYAQYGKYVQMPSLNQLYVSNVTLSSIVNPSTRSPYNLGGSAAGFLMKPERSTTYELGFRQILTDNLGLTVTGFYKDEKDKLQLKRVFNANGNPLFVAFQNEDFGTSSGLELTLELRRTNRLSAKVNYTLSDARGTGSTSRSSQNSVTDDITARYPNFVYPLDFNETHIGSAVIDYRYAKGEGGLLEGVGVNALVTFNSGHNYTKIQEPQNLGQASPWNIGVRSLIDSRSRTPLESINSSQTPWYFNMDLTANKTLYLPGVTVDLFVRIENLLNTKHILNFFPTTSTADDDGWLKNPFAVSYKNIENYEAFYRDVILANRWAYMNIGAQGGLGQMAGGDLFGKPRQVRFGLKAEL
ncbi:MAG: TonB-dependent receptor [Bacteroidetes bacterium]|nr:TonB-dependent receptor [Bacteroidota bacterium]